MGNRHVGQGLSVARSHGVAASNPSLGPLTAARTDEVLALAASAMRYGVEAKAHAWMPWRLAVNGINVAESHPTPGNRGFWRRAGPWSIVRARASVSGSGSLTFTSLE